MNTQIIKCTLPCVDVYIVVISLHLDNHIVWRYSRRIMAFCTNKSIVITGSLYKGKSVMQEYIATGDFGVITDSISFFSRSTLIMTRNVKKRT